MKTSPEIQKAPGIYRISIGPRTFYWGQAQNLRARAGSHLSALRRGDHGNQQLQRSFDKHGEAAYVFEVSLLCPEDDLDMQEQFALDIFHGTAGCANVALVAEASARGLRRSDETKAKMSAAQTGKKPSDETRAKISAANKGRKHSAEARAKISAAQMGVPRTPEAAAASRNGRRAQHPNILVVYTGGREEVWPSQSSLGVSLGYKNNGPISLWLTGREQIPAKYNIASISRTDLPATIDPEAL